MGDASEGKLREANAGRYSFDHCRRHCISPARPGEGLSSTPLSQEKSTLVQTSTRRGWGMLPRESCIGPLLGQFNRGWLTHDVRGQTKTAGSGGFASALPLHREPRRHCGIAGSRAQKGACLGHSSSPIYQRADDLSYSFSDGRNPPTMREKAEAVPHVRTSRRSHVLDPAGASRLPQDGISTERNALHNFRHGE